MLNGLAGLASKTKLLLNENSSTILSGIAIGGTAATAYLTGRATFKAARLIEKENFERLAESLGPNDRPDGFDLSVEALSADHLTNFEKAKLVWHHYIPPVVAAATTITCIVMANKIASKKIAALAISAGISERALQEYKAKVVERLGPKQDTAIRDEIAQDRVSKQPVQSGEVIVVGTGEVLFYDMTTGRYFQSTVEEVKKAVNKVNHDLNNFMYTSLSSFYDEIGLPPTTYSDQVGWNANAQMDVQLSTTLSSDNRPCIAIEFTPVPFAEYDRTYD